MSLEVNIKKDFGTFQLDVSFYHNGNCMGILGASGCGKSMTLKCIAGIERPDTGRIVLNKKVLFDSEKRINLPPQKRNIGYMFQNYALFPTMTIEQNIGAGLKTVRGERKKIIADMITYFHLEGLEKRYPGQLSGGQQQRVALARILAYQPEIIMLDEPFSALDIFLKDTLQQELLETLKKYNGDILLVSHSRDEIFKFCDVLSVMDQGHVIVKGNTREIFRNPLKVIAARLTGCKNISRIKKKNDYELEALDWGISLKTAEYIGDNIRYIGIRGHRLIPSVSGDVENAMPIELFQMTEAPFEVLLLVRNANVKQSKNIWWMRAKNNMDSDISEPVPKFLVFPKEEILLLEE